MKMMRFAILPLLLCAFFGASTKTNVTPIQKVLSMLGSMLEKAKAGRHAEQVEWSAFKTFCSGVELEKQTSIQKADVQKESLNADIEQHNSEVKRLTKEITDHGTDIKGYKADAAKATTDRAAARVAYEKTHEDYSESISAIAQAIAVLKKQAADIPQAASLLQNIKGLAQLPAASKRALDAFLELGQETKEMQALSAPEANSYEFQSDTIVTMLVELKDKFVDERTALEKKQMVSVQASDTVLMDLRNSISAAENEIDKKGSSKAENIGQSTESSTLLGEVKTSRDDDQKYLTSLITTCQQKSADFKSRQTLRQEEMVAVEKAIEIISGGAVSGAAEKHLPAMLQGHKGTSFVQFLAGLQKPSSQQNAVAFLNAESQRLDSHVLSAIAMQAAADPFVKVKKLIGDLITKLKEQEAEEAGHKKWCDEELKTNGQTRKDKSTEVDSLTSDIDQLESRLEKLKKDLATLSTDVAEINAAVAKAGEIREKEKGINEATIVEAVEGQTAIAQAKKVLSDFYKKAGAAVALTQLDAEQPSGYDSPFQGQQKQSSNVLSFLEVISSDFARLEGDTKKAESESQSEHDTFMAESKKSKDAKEGEQKTKEKEQLEKTGTLSTKNDDLESAQAQLDAALGYFDKLKPSCINTAVPYDDRVQRREEEVASLKEALEILNGEGVPSGPDALYSSTQGGNLAVDNR